MAVMARVMGATLMGTQELLGKNKKLGLAVSLTSPAPSIVLRQHQALWQNCRIVTQHNGQGF